MEISAEVLSWYLNHAFEQFVHVAERLGDDRVTQRPLGETTTSVSGLVHHCVGVTEFWLGHVALGRPTLRERDSEFTAEATVAELVEMLGAAAARATEDIGRIEAGETLPSEIRQFIEGGPTDGSIVVHVLEEVYQHLGHAELAADALLR